MTERIMTKMHTKAKVTIVHWDTTSNNNWERKHNRSLHCESKEVFVGRQLLYKSFKNFYEGLKEMNLDAAPHWNQSCLLELATWP